MSNEYAVNRADLVSVADAIRSKGETTEQLVFPGGFVTAVNSLGKSGATLTVTTPAEGVTVTVTKGELRYTKTTGADGTAVFTGLATGDWIITITDGILSTTKIIAVTTDYNVRISFNTIPEFTYTGSYKIVNDADQEISNSQDNWKIRFMTSGTLIFNNLNGASDGIDVFLVGGGGGGGTTNRDANASDRGGCGGGGGGYTKTVRAITVASGIDYSIVVGAGGGAGAQGGTSSAFDYSASGGQGGTNAYESGQYGTKGGNGGSGGGKGSYSDGASDGNSSSGTGQGTTTREFGEPGNTLYAGGGGGGSHGVTAGTGGAGGGGNGATQAGTPNSGTVNTGGGGGGGGKGQHTIGGGSGIVIIRNKRGGS